MKRVNLPLVAAIVIILLGIAAGVPLLHRFQLRRNAENMIRQAESKLEEGDEAEAIRLLTRYVNLRPGDAQQHSRLARLLLGRVDSGVVDTAGLRATASALEVAVRKNPGDLKLRLDLAGFLSRVGEFDGALDHLSILISKFDDGSPGAGHGAAADEQLTDEEKARAKLLYATTAALDRRHDEAERALSALVGYDPAAKSFDPDFVVPPGRVEAFGFLASILESERRDSKSAAAVIERMVELYPDDAQAWMLTAIWRMDHNSLDAAEAAAERALELAPEDDRVAMVALRAANAAGHRDRAREILDGPLLDAAPTEAIIMARADLARLEGNTERSIAVLREGLETFPENRVLMTAVLSMLADLQDTDELRAAITDYRAKLPKDTPAVDYAEGMLAMKEQRWLPALQIWEKLRPLVAADAALTRRVDLALARCHAALGQGDQATDARTRAFAAVPGSAAARLAEMNGHEAAGRWDEALTVADDLAREVPSDKLASLPELWRPLFRLRLIDQARKPAGERQWNEVDSLLDQLASSPEMKGPLIERLRIDALAARNESAAAIEASAAAVAAHPDDAGLLAQRVILLVATGQPDEARALLDAAPAPLRDSEEILGAEIDLASASTPRQSTPWMADVEQRVQGLSGPMAERLYRQLIAVHVGRGSTADAERLANRFIATNPDDLPVRELLLDIADERNDIGAVKVQSGEIMRIAGSDSATGRVAQAVARIVTVRAGRLSRVSEDATAAALTAEERRDLESARGLLAQASGDRPRWSEIPRQLAAIAEIQGDRPAAIGLLRKATELREAIPFAKRQLAILLVASRRLDEARSVIESLGNTGGPAVDRIRADWSAATGGIDAALALGAQLTPDDCRDPEQLLWYAGLLARSGRQEEAEAICRRAVDAAPENADTWLALLTLDMRAGDSDRAADTRRRALATLEGTARDRFEILADGIAPTGEAMGEEGLRGGDALEASYRAAIAENPDDLAGARRLVQLLLRRQQNREARAELRRILSLDAARDTTTLLWARRLLANQLAADGGYREFQEAIALLAKNVDDSERQMPEDMTMSIQLLLRRPEPASWRQAMVILDSLATRRSLTADERVMQALLQAKLNPKLRTKARDELIGIAASNEASTAVFTSLAEFLLDGNDTVMAKRWVEKLRSVAPQATDTLRLEAKLAVAEGNREEAARIVESLVPKEPIGAGNVPRWMAAAATAEQLGFPEVADKVFGVLAGTSPEGVLRQAQAIGRGHRTAEALALVEPVREKVSVMAFLDTVTVILRGSNSPLDAPAQAMVNQWMEKAVRENPDGDQVAIQTAIIAEQLGEIEKAIGIYRKLLAENRLSGIQAGLVAGNLAWLLARPDTADEAGELVDRAVRDLGPHPDLLDTRALVRLAKGQTALALEDMDDALLSPSAVKYIHLAAIRMAVNDLEGAKSALEQSQKLGLGDLNLQPDEARRVEQVEAAIAAGGQGDS